VADLLVLVTCTPTTLVEIITRRDDWILGKVSNKTNVLTEKIDVKFRACNYNMSNY